MFNPQIACRDVMHASGFLREILKIEDEIETGVILGTGWNEAFHWEHSIAFEKIPGMGKLSPMKGHPRKVAVGKIGSKRVIVLCGRVHMHHRYENPQAPDMVRLQVEMMLSLGVRRVIATCAGGGLQPTINPGLVLAVKNFITIFGPPMPLRGNEHPRPERALSDDLRKVAESVLEKAGAGKWTAGNYAMVQGPNFETRQDKEILMAFGANMVGMSMVPEACFCDLHHVPMLGLVNITSNDIRPPDDADPHTLDADHEKNVRKGEERSQKLARLLTDIIAAI